MSVSTLPQNAIRIEGESLTRTRVEALLATRNGSLVLSDCDLEGLDLSRLDLRGVGFVGCNLAEASFSRANLCDTSWKGCRARQADFALAQLSDARFVGCDLNNTSWAGAKLAAAAFIGVKLTGADLSTITGLGLHLEDTLLVAANLRGLSFRKQTLNQLDFSDADLAGCDFREAVFEGGSLRQANLRQARFEGADLRQADLGGLRLNDAALFKGALISYQQAGALLQELGVLVG